MNEKGIDGVYTSVYSVTIRTWTQVLLATYTIATPIDDTNFIK